MSSRGERGGLPIRFSLSTSSCRPTKFEMVIISKLQKRSASEVSPLLLARADEVIE
jgi:hypothetical protein